MAVELVRLLASFSVNAVPVARRLMQLREEHGWSGWTQLAPVTGRHGRIGQLGTRRRYGPPGAAWPLTKPP